MGVHTPFYLAIRATTRAQPAFLILPLPAFDALLA